MRVSRWLDNLKLDYWTQPIIYQKKRELALYNWHKLWALPIALTIQVNIIPCPPPYPPSVTCPVPFYPPPPPHSRPLSDDATAEQQNHYDTESYKFSNVSALVRGPCKTTIF
jgi:hypothetical protein